MVTKYHLTWSSKHKAVRRVDSDTVEQAAYVILMPTLTPHNASSDRASHRYFHSSQWVASDGRLIMGDHNPCVAYVRCQCGIFTRRIFASAQRFRRVASFGSPVTSLLRLLNEHVLTSG
jgi:hypothetical protein